MATIQTSIAIPLLLSFNNLTYSVKNKETKILLNDVSGEASDGEILAVLGPSGSGKSTLIDTLANRTVVKGSLKGTINLNGQNLDSNLLKIISAYVMQDDLLFPMLTVEETLMFAAELKLPRFLSKSKKKKRVEDLIDQLDLKNAVNTVIGDEGHRGVSGGERRRVSIGIDIIHDPILLFLDEPTSGLDSTSAFAVVRVLQKIAQSGSIVIMSIHQPSYRILCLMNRLIFLSHGEVVYSGSPFKLSVFLGDFGFQIPEDENPSEAALDLIRDLENSTDGTKGLVEFNKKWQNQNPNPRADEFQGNYNSSLNQAIASSISRGKLVYGGTEVQKFANPIWVEILALSKRSYLNSRRMPELFAVRFGATFITAILLATLYLGVDLSPVGNSERIRFVGFAITTVFFVCTDGIPGFLQERNIFLRETSFNSYRKSSYCLSHALVWIPSLFFLSITFSSITFWGTNTASNGGGFWPEFLFYLGIIMGSFWTGNSFVTLIIEIVPHVMLGYVVVVATLSYFLLFCGLFIDRDRIPSYWVWFHYISPKKYANSAVLHNIYDDPTTCFVRGIQFLDGTPFDSMISMELKEKLLNNIGKTLGRNITGSSCLTTGADILKERGVSDLSKWDCFWITIAWGFFFRILFYFALLMGGTKNKRK
ncbi:hypothetical protein M9H77_28700 [Catharanthus roseus]|uniref:Uncharacterized protein n=1 Tax=Catharanthus roseus TaxID=4058 RepID=A0ACC0AG35_CATRO|nr:hypothetical protein M9H77_28700 [Catharanthus roseus]